MIYRLVNKPWDTAPKLLRAKRFTRLRRAADEQALITFWQDMRATR